MSWFTRITVLPWEAVLQRVPGQPTVVLPVGRHRTPRRARFERVELREQIEALAPQEVLTADGVTLKVTAAIRWAVADPICFTETAMRPVSVVYLAVQVALRDALSALDASEAIARARVTVTDAMTDAAMLAAQRVGIEVREVVVKDIVLPSDLRAAYAEQVTARQRGLAQLEQARAETAALRSLANGAKLLADNPALARLRLVQALPYGSTIKLIDSGN